MRRAAPPFRSAKKANWRGERIFPGCVMFHSARSRWDMVSSSDGAREKSTADPTGAIVERQMLVRLGVDMREAWEWAWEG